MQSTHRKLGNSIIGWQSTDIPRPDPIPCTKFNVWCGRDAQHIKQAMQVRLESDGSVFMSTDDKRDGKSNLLIKHMTFSAAFDLFRIITNKRLLGLVVTALDGAIRNLNDVLFCEELKTDLGSIPDLVQDFASIRAMFEKLAKRGPHIPGVTVEAPKA